ncbi:MAG: biotin--[acetyl-CoA-carboxylase] ligase [Alphaproteobacteria bacterium]|nr:biotin--[acetyl-CoA-carboxylase] ligase [Alphaproteobacteria bacterium]
MNQDFALGRRAADAGARLLIFDTVGSTNAAAMQCAREGECGPLWLVTGNQSDGHGRRSRAWISPPGNLAASMLEVMDVPMPVVATLGFAAGLAAHAALRQVAVEAAAMAGAETGAMSAVPDFVLKWPNDVLVGGRKIAGINLEVESRGDAVAVVVGIGINVVAAPQDSTLAAVSLAELGVAASAQSVFAALSDAWACWRPLWDRGRGFPLVRSQWLGAATGLGSKVAIRTGASLTEGIFAGIDDQGCLILDTGERLVGIAAGDVYFGDVASRGAGA